MSHYSDKSPIENQILEEKETDIAEADPLHKTQGAGLGLIVVSACSIIITLMELFRYFLHGMLSFTEDWISASGWVVALILYCVINGVTAIAGVYMRKGSNYGTCRLGAVLALIPCLSPLGCLGIPFGIWALAAMDSQEVRSRFANY